MGVGRVGVEGGRELGQASKVAGRSFPGLLLHNSFIFWLSGGEGPPDQSG